MRNYMRPAKRWDYCVGPGYIWPGARGNVREAVKRNLTLEQELKRVLNDRKK